MAILPDTAQIAVVRKDVRASTEFALKRLGIAQRRLSLRRQADVRQDEATRRSVSLHEPDETALGGWTRLAKQEHIMIFEICDAPAVLVRPVTTTAARKGLQRETDGSRIATRHGEQLTHRGPCS